MKILILPKYHREGSSSRYRYYNYLEWFQQDNHAVRFAPLLYNGYVADLYKGRNKIKRIVMTVCGILQRSVHLVLKKNQFDIIIIEKELVTFMPFFLERLLLRGTKFIVDYDDNINARYQTGWAKLFLSRKIVKLASLANAVTVGNHWYFDLFKDTGLSKIHYLPTVIDRRLYSTTTIIKQPNTPLTMAWIGSPATIKYLKDLEDVLRRLQSQYNYTLKVIGAVIPLKLHADFVEWHATTEIAELKEADIGIMPLRDTDWEKGKCGLKLIQYMACGLPVVASWSVANAAIVQPGCGFIAHTSEEWFDHLAELLTAADLRKKLGANGKERVYTDYACQVWGPFFVNLVKTIAGPILPVS